MHSVLHLLVPRIPPGIHCNDLHQHHFSLFFDLHVGRINLGTLSAGFTSHCSWVSGWSTPVPSSMSGSLSASPSCSLSFGLSKSKFQSCQFSVSKMLSCALSSSRSTGWRSIHWIRRMITIWLLSTRMFLTDEAGSKGDLSGNFNAAALSCWKFDQEGLRISSESDIYATAVNCSFWARDSFCVAHRFWLPCHISKKLWTFTILYNFLSCSCLFISNSVSVFMLSNAGSLSANILSVAGSSCYTTTFSWIVLPVVFDCLQPIISPTREKLFSDPTPCGMTENMSHATLERLVDFECSSSCWCHQLAICSIFNELLISLGSEWKSDRFGLTCPQYCGNPANVFK